MTVGGHTLRLPARPGVVPPTSLPKVCRDSPVLKAHSCRACGSAAAQIHSRCGGATPTGYNVTLHVPIIPQDLPYSIDKLLAALRAMTFVREGPEAFRFEQTMVAVDAVKKTRAGAIAACCRAEARLEASPRLVEGLLRTSQCVQIRQLRYEHSATPVNRLFSPFPATQSSRFAMDNVTFARLAAGKTHLQFYALLANTWKLSTRFVLHLDVDAILMWAAPVPWSTSERLPLVEALMRHVRHNQQMASRSLGVSVEACRTAWACLQPCPGLAYPQNWSHAGAKIIHPEAFVLDLPRFLADRSLKPFRIAQQFLPERLLIEGLDSATTIIDRILDKWAFRNRLATRFARLPTVSSGPTGGICHSTYFHLDRLANYSYNRVVATGGLGGRFLARCCDEACKGAAATFRCEHKLERLQRTWDAAPPAMREAAAMCSRA